ncbi:hypothetical protein K438DRAFT_1754341 [Mycena galopus ATCC 62051]|nr:hypothetical protein K438DRAFT_1754341 [Mycena galopus ATCC 62051]
MAHSLFKTSYIAEFPSRWINLKASLFPTVLQLRLVNVIGYYSKIRNSGDRARATLGSSTSIRAALHRSEAYCSSPKYLEDTIKVYQGQLKQSNRPCILLSSLAKGIMPNRWMRYKTGKAMSFQPPLLLAKQIRL